MMNIHKIRYSNFLCNDCAPYGPCSHALSYDTLKKHNYQIVVVHIGKPGMFMKWYEVYKDGQGKYSYARNDLYTRQEVLPPDVWFCDYWFNGFTVRDGMILYDCPGLTTHQPELSLDVYLKFDSMPATFDLVLGKSGVCSRGDARKNGWNFPLPQEKDFDDFWLVYGKKKQTCFMFCNFYNDENREEYSEAAAIGWAAEFDAMEIYGRY